MAGIWGFRYNDSNASLGPKAFDTLAPGRCANKFINAIFKHIIQIEFMNTFCEGHVTPF